MILSRYNCFLEGYPSENDVLVFNTRTEAFFKINSQLYNALQNLANGGTNDSEYIQYKDALYTSGIIAYNEQEEDQQTNDFFDQLRVGDEYDMNVMFLTTYACNFSCVYCFQGPLQEKSMMTKETANAAVLWIKNELRIKGFKQLSICFYGGEPLLNKEIMYYAIEELKSFCEGNDISFNLAMITNGSLLSEEIIKKMMDYGLKELRISVDGNKGCHDKRRPYKNGQGTFDDVMKNIKVVSKYIKPLIIGTYDKDTVDGPYGLLDYLEENDLLDRIDTMGFAPLTPRMGSKNQPGSVEMADCSQMLESDDLTLELLNMNKAIRAKGLPVRANMGINICPMIMKNQGAIIDPYGNIYSCVAFIGHDEYVVGNVKEAGYNKKSEEFAQIKAWELCPKDCVYLPMCQGGCRFMAYAENKDVCSMCCKKSFTDTMMPELMKFKYDDLAAGA